MGPTLFPRLLSLLLGAMAIDGPLSMSARADPASARRTTPRMRKRFLALLILAPILLIAAATIRPPRIFCDGVVAPVWAGDPCGGGYVPTLLEYVWPPEHWFAPSRCYGMCEQQPKGG